MKNAVYIFMFGGFVATRLLAPAHMEALWQDELFSDPNDDGAGWRFATMLGGSVLEIREEDGVALEVWERPQDRDDDWRFATSFPYAKDGLILRTDAYDAMSRWIAGQVGFVEKPFQVLDLTHLSGAELEAAMAEVR